MKYRKNEYCKSREKSDKNMKFPGTNNSKKDPDSILVIMGFFQELVYSFVQETRYNYSCMIKSKFTLVKIS